MKPLAWLLPSLVAAAFVTWVFLPTRAPAPQSAGMKTLSKPAARSKPARKTARRAPSHGFAISPVTGLPFKPLAPGQKPVSRETLKAALADSL